MERERLCQHLLANKRKKMRMISLPAQSLISHFLIMPESSFVPGCQCGTEHLAVASHPRGGRQS